MLAYDPLPGARGLTDRLANLLANYALPLLPGYLYRFGEKYKLYPGIIFNTAFLIAAVSVWITVIISVGEGREAYASLAFVLLAILIFLLLFGGAAFFLDRYRIPLSLAVLLYVYVVGASSGTDHIIEWRSRAGAAVFRNLLRRPTY